MIVLEPGTPSRARAVLATSALPDPLLVVVDGEVAGACGWYAPPGDDGEVEIGYGLAARYRGRGLGREMVAALLAWVAARPGVRRVVASTDVTNVPSRRILERLGFALDSVDGHTARYVTEPRSVTRE